MPDKAHLSTKSIAVDERLIVALDVESYQEAIDLVDSLGDEVKFYKLGLELFAAGNYFDLAQELVTMKDKRVFVDLKFFDVPETVRRAVSRLKKYDVDFVTVHGNEEMIRAACEEKNGIKVLAVTVLTSLDNRDLEAFGFKVDVEELVLSRAMRALAAGCDGVISSGLEAPRLRDQLGERFLIVSPGIRPVENQVVREDQKRVVSVSEAFLNGADYIVVGRPIRDAPDPRAAAAQIQAEIREIFEGSE
jgi:orotidine-5'-phosphate decarboxylase